MIRSKISHWAGLFRLGLLVLGMLCVVSVSSLHAQHKNITITTDDDVRLGATYYPSTMQNAREAVPIVILHDYKEGRTVFNGLAQALQNPNPEDRRFESHAVLTVDLRGHGSSTTAVGANGETFTLDAARLRPADFEDMVRLDMEAVRKFLVEKNDAEELNLNKLCLIGTGMGADVALIWAAVDWAAPPLANRKQGQDVKALILVSPIWRQKGLSLVDAVQDPAVTQMISTMIVYGDENATAKKDAENVYKNFERFHPEPPLDKIREQKDLFKFALPTEIEGSKLLTEPRFEMLPRIELFLKNRLTDQRFEWVQRKLE